MIASIAFSSRLAGAMLMHAIKASPMVERFLDALSVSVMAALVTSIVAQGDLRSAVAVSLAALVMFATNSAIWSMMAGMGSAALWFWVTSP